MPETLDVNLDVNEYLNENVDRIDAAFTVTANGFSGGSAARVVVAVLDVSGSMGEEGGTKLNAARRATATLVDMLDPSTWFSVISFCDYCRIVTPLTQATPGAKQQAKGAITALKAEGTTKMSLGLQNALNEFMKQPGADGTCIFLTDGQNDADDQIPLEAQLKRCVELRQQGRVFQVQSRGIGLHWKVDQLRLIAERTLGEPPRPIFDAKALEQDFAACLQTAMSTALSDVRVNLWVPQNVSIVEMKQITPNLVKLSGAETLSPDGQTHIFTTGAWENEAREFYAALRIAPRPVGKRVCAGRVSISYRVGGQDHATVPQMIAVQWTDNQSLSARIPLGVAKATGQVELASNIQEGVKAYEDGNLEVATQKLGRAVQLAAQTGHDEMTTRLKGIVDIVNAEEGTVRVKKATKEAVMDLDAASTRTVRGRK